VIPGILSKRAEEGKKEVVEEEKKKQYSTVEKGSRKKKGGRILRFDNNDSTKTNGDSRRDVYFIQAWNRHEYPPWPCIFPSDEAPIVYIGDSRTLINEKGQPVSCGEVQKKFSTFGRFRSSKRWLDSWTNMSTTSLYVLSSPEELNSFSLDSSFLTQFLIYEGTQ
jgi:hypothetical protein